LIKELATGYNETGVISVPNKYREGTAALYLRLPEEWKRRLFELAKKKGRPATELARKAIIEYVEREEKIF
jgi:predicted DNA-binding protein